MKTEKKSSEVTTIIFQDQSGGYFKIPFEVPSEKLEDFKMSDDDVERLLASKQQSGVQQVHSKTFPTVPSSFVRAVPSPFVRAVPSSFVRAVPSSFVRAVPSSFVRAVPSSFVRAVPSSFVRAVPGSRVAHRLPTTTAGFRSPSGNIFGSWIQ